MSFILFSMLIWPTVQQNSLEAAALSLAFEHTRQQLAPTYSFNLKNELLFCEISASAPCEANSGIKQIWRSGTKYREDSTLVSSGRTPPHPNIGERRVHCLNCERDGHLIATTICQNSRLSTIVTFPKINEMKSSDILGIDWAYYGCHSGWLGSNRGDPVLGVFESMKSEPGWTVTRKRRDGFDCIVASNQKDSWTTSVWLRPDLGMNPVYIDKRTAAPDNKYPTVIENVIEYTIVGKNLYYPSKVVYAYSFDGRQIRKATTTLSDIQFANPINPSIFTLAGLGLQEGQAIVYPEIKDMRDAPIWRNGKVDKDWTIGKEQLTTLAQATSEVAAPEKVLAPFPDQRRDPLLYVFAGIAGILSAVVIVYALVTRRR